MNPNGDGDMKLNREDYTILNDSTIIIHSNVNKTIYFGYLKKNITQIIFSNYANPHLQVKYNCWEIRNNKFNSSFDTNCSKYECTNKFANRCSKFNSYMYLTNSITHLTCGTKFNKFLRLSNSLSHLILGCNFNQPLELTKNLTHLVFDNFFLKPLSSIKNLTHLSCDITNRNYIDIGSMSKLTHLEITYESNSELLICPDSLTHLIIGKGCGYDYNLQIILPDSLTFLIFTYYNQSIELPASLTQLALSDDFNQLIKLPNLLTHLDLGRDFNQPVEFKDNLIYLSFGENFNQFVDIPVQLIYLIFSCNFSGSIDLPNVKYLVIRYNNTYLIENFSNELETLCVTHPFDLPLDNLPSQLKSLNIFNYVYNQKLNNLPNSIKYIRLNEHYDHPILSIPTNLQTIKCHRNYKYLNLLKKYKRKNNLKFLICIY